MIHDIAADLEYIDFLGSVVPPDSYYENYIKILRKKKNMKVKKYTILSFNYFQLSFISKKYLCMYLDFT